MSVWRTLIAVTCLAASTLTAQPRLAFRASKDVVLINASVFDRNGRVITGLDASNFRLFEEKQPVDIRQLSLEETPLSTVILLDLSGSMTDGIGYVRDALRRYLDRSNPGDEFCLISFSSNIHNECSFTTDTGAVLRQAASGPPKGKTALFDALVVAFASVKKATNARRAILVLSDGIETGSRYGWRETQEYAKETTACVYLVRPGTWSDDDRGSLIRMADIIELTGGRVFEINRVGNLPQFMEHLDIRQQYLLAFDPPRAARDGKYRRVTVKLQGTGDQRLRVYWRHGYFAPNQTD